MYTAVAPLTLQLWHERLNHTALYAVERAVQHVEGLIIDSKAHPPHLLPCQLASSIVTPFLPLYTVHDVFLN